MTKEQLMQRIKELEQRHATLADYIQKATAERYGLEGAILELRRLLQDMEAASDD